MHIGNDKLENKKHLNFRSKFVSYKMSTFLGKSDLFLMQGDLSFAGNYCSAS